jgi:hypothetical protein
MTMDSWIGEIAMVVRAALRGWPETLRLCVLVVVAVAAATVIASH